MLGTAFTVDARVNEHDALGALHIIYKVNSMDDD
jgi:hypothetical protein